MKVIKKVDKEPWIGETVTCFLGCGTKFELEAGDEVKKHEVSESDSCPSGIDYSVECPTCGKEIFFNFGG